AARTEMALLAQLESVGAKHIICDALRFPVDSKQDALEVLWERQAITSESPYRAIPHKRFIASFIHGNPEEDFKTNPLIIDEVRRDFLQRLAGVAGVDNWEKLALAATEFEGAKDIHSFTPDQRALLGRLGAPVVYALMHHDVTLGSPDDSATTARLDEELTDPNFKLPDGVTIAQYREQQSQLAIARQIETAMESGLRKEALEEVLAEIREHLKENRSILEAAEADTIATDAELASDMNDEAKAEVERRIKSKRSEIPDQIEALEVQYQTALRAGLVEEANQIKDSIQKLHKDELRPRVVVIHRPFQDRNELVRSSAEIEILRDDLREVQDELSRLSEEIAVADIFYGSKKDLGEAVKSLDEQIEAKNAAIVSARSEGGDTTTLEQEVSALQSQRDEVQQHLEEGESIEQRARSLEAQQIDLINQIDSLETQANRTYIDPSIFVRDEQRLMTFDETSDWLRAGGRPAVGERPVTIEHFDAPTIARVRITAIRQVQLDDFTKYPGSFVQDRLISA
ncbi:MAG: hypothetical protein KDD53_10370, partial [Bdellovibrionales bacterium]|nr:hypothetical protein [Bdellovibrionales bacterium]